MIQSATCHLKAIIYDDPVDLSVILPIVVSSMHIITGIFGTFPDDSFDATERVLILLIEIVSIYFNIAADF